MKMTGAQIIVETLIEQGTNTVFGFPGGTVLNIYDELYKNADRIHHYITSHEQGAAHAADGYARVTGKVGVVIATSGPGATNLVTGIANAYLDSTPMVAITGNVALPLIGRDSFQEVDITGITMPITKHNYIVKDIESLADIIREAFAIAKSGRPGPVLIDIPKDIQTASCEFVSKGIEPAVPYRKCSTDTLDEAAKLIAAAQRPYIYAGGGVVISNASKEILALAERIDAPVGASMMGLSSVPNEYPGFLGMTGMHGQYAATKAIAHADLILAVGTRFSDRSTGKKSEYAKNSKTIHIDIDPAEIGKNIPAYTSLIGNVKDVLAELLKRIAKQEHPEWHKEIQELKKHAEEGISCEGQVTPRELILAAHRHMPKDGMIATDVGQHQMWTAQYYPFSLPRTFVTSGGLGTMGFGMGAAIGSCIGSGEKRTLLFTGDGSFHMNLNELSTAVSNALPLVIMIMNNNSLGMVRQWQSLFFDKRYSNTTLNRKTDYVKLAEAFGAKGLRISKREDIESVMQQAFSEKTPVVIDCVIGCDEMVFPMIPPNGTIDDIILK